VARPSCPAGLPTFCTLRAAAAAKVRAPAWQPSIRRYQRSLKVSVQLQTTGSSAEMDSDHG